MQALTDEQLHDRHTMAQNQVAYHLANGHENIMGSWVRQAHAAQKEILARGRFANAKG